MTEREAAAIHLSLQSQFRVANESIEISGATKNRETRTYRLGIARNVLATVRQTAAAFAIRVDGLAVAETAIARIEAGADGANHAQRTSTLGMMQERTLGEWGNADILSGVRFCATLQLCTPLRVLQWHGRVIIACWSEWVRRLGDRDAIARAYFPSFIETIRGLSSAAVSEW